MNGCGKYFALLEKGYKASDRGQSIYFLKLARLHQDECEDCKRINTPLEEQLFGQRVEVVGEK